MGKVQTGLPENVLFHRNQVNLIRTPANSSSEQGSPLQHSPAFTAGFFFLSPELLAWMTGYYPSASPQEVGFSMHLTYWYYTFLRDCCINHVAAAEEFLDGHHFESSHLVGKAIGYTSQRPCWGCAACFCILAARLLFHHVYRHIFMKVISGISSLLSYNN